MHSTQKVVAGAGPEPELLTRVLADFVLLGLTSAGMCKKFLHQNILVAVGSKS